MNGAALVYERAGGRTQDRVGCHNRVGLRCWLGCRGSEGNGDIAARRSAGGIDSAAVVNTTGGGQRDAAAIASTGSRRDGAGLVDCIACLNNHRAAGRSTGSVDQARLVDGGCSGKLHRAARGLAGGIQRTAVVNLVGPGQPDHAAATGDGVGLHGTRVVDHRALQLARRHGGHQHLPVRGLDQLFVFDQGLDGGWVNLDVDQVAAVKLERDPFARRQCHGAMVGGDRAAVDHRRADEGDIAAVGCGDLAIIDHRRRRSVASEVVFAVGKVLVGDIHRRGDQPTDIHLRGLAEDHAARIDQKHLPVGGQLALNHRGITLQHPVECHGIGVGLLELDLRRRADVEGLPVQRGLLGGLVDLQLRRTQLRDRRLAGDDLPTGGQRGRHWPGHARTG